MKKALVLLAMLFVGCSKPATPTTQSEAKREVKPVEWVETVERYEPTIKITQVIVPDSHNRRYVVHYMQGNELKQVRFNGPEDSYKIVCDVPEGKPVFALSFWKHNKAQPSDYFHKRYEIHLHNPEEALNIVVKDE